MKNQKIMMIAGGAVLVIILTAVVAKVAFTKKTQVTPKTPDETQNQVIPTVDASVKVNLTPIKKGEVSLTVENVPSGTKSIDCEFTYDAKNTNADEGSGVVSQGAIVKCAEIDGLWQCGEPSGNSRKIILGTCSSGVCRYHNIVGPIRVSMKFSGSYGEKLFDKEFTINND